MNQKEREAIARILEPDAVIVELGAYCGEEAAIFESMTGPDFLHIMVEPDPRNYKVIMEGMQLNPNRRLIPAAIAAQDGIRIFRRSTDSRDGSRGSGSILEPTGHLEHFPTIAFDDGFEVKCYTLDRIFRENQLDHIDLLYVDIQGAESEMIAGGQAALEQTHFLFIEAESVEMYAGQATKPELLKLLPGWKVLEDFGFNILLENGAYR